MSKTITGVVSSSKGDKTIVITEHVRKTHPLYKKQYTVTTKFMAHDEKNEAQVGDKVMIGETRPISARKRFKLKEILIKATLREEDKQALKVEEPKKPEKKADKEEEPKKPEAKE